MSSIDRQSGERIPIHPQAPLHPDIILAGKESYVIANVPNTPHRLLRWYVAKPGTTVDQLHETICSTEEHLSFLQQHGVAIPERQHFIGIDPEQEKGDDNLPAIYTWVQNITGISPRTIQENPVDRQQLIPLANALHSYFEWATQTQPYLLWDIFSLDQYMYGKPSDASPFEVPQLYLLDIDPYRVPVDDLAHNQAAVEEARNELDLWSNTLQNPKR
ncbi:MAG TPA: hypothetical protein VMY99_05360 [Nevskiaceae bacterium]|nr:hypothetical protein [Nevskiaceae bacterium]